MTLETFKNKLQMLHTKSGMDCFVDWPFVYDEDELGRIYVDQHGIFWFTDQHSNWIESHLNLCNIENMRYSKAFEEPGVEFDEDMPVAESSIYIQFLSGDSVLLHNFADTFTVRVYVYIKQSATNLSVINRLKESCHKLDWLEFTLHKSEQL